MSPWLFCFTCKRAIIGDEKYKCSVCLKLKIAYEIKYNFYINSIKYLNLPDDIINLIANNAAKNSIDLKIYNIHSECWKTIMHSRYPYE
tara:strand:+ start:245 stop:511 length:267 start_codon:yes stop_codon:yes gene_type:complete